MMDISVSIENDTATPALKALDSVLSPRSNARLQQAVGRECVLLTQRHLGALGPNKNGWPSTGFYKGAARGTDFDVTETGVVIRVDNERAPGGMRQRYHGGTISMKDKLLAIPARAEFYGHSPTEFTNLRFFMFASGTKTFVIGKGGVGKVNFQTGRERSVSGAGAREQAMVAYWLKESVNQRDGDPDVMPSPQEYAETAKAAIVDVVEEALKAR